MSNRELRLFILTQVDDIVKPFIHQLSKYGICHCIIAQSIRDENRMRKRLTYLNFTNRY